MLQKNNYNGTRYKVNAIKGYLKHQKNDFNINHQKI